jgi:hypothetical protein
VGTTFVGAMAGEKPAWSIAYRSGRGRPDRSSDKVHWVGINNDDNLQAVALKDPLSAVRLVDLPLRTASVRPYWVRRNGG